MSWSNSFAIHANARIKGRNDSGQRFGMLALLPLIIVLALVPAFASAILFSSLFGSSAHAFSATSFSVDPGAKQAAGHPNLNVKLSRSGSDNEDIKTVVVELAPGLLANPEAAKYKCSSFYFSIDLCSKESQVGVISTDVTAMGLLPMTVAGDIEVLTPNTTDAATLGYVLRPIGSAIGVLSKVFIKNNVTVNSQTDYGLKNSHLNLPTTTKAVVGLVPVPITIEAMDLTFRARANQWQSGKYFMINPSSCAPATSKLTMTSYQLVTDTRTSTFTPTGCENVPFTPTMTATYTNLNSEKSTGTSVTLSQITTDASQQSSTLKKAVLTYPQGSGLDFDVLDALVGCTDSQFRANSCPAGSQIGTASAAVPFLPPSFSGKIYSLDPIGATLSFGILLSGPRGVKAYIYGKASVVGTGPDQRVVATVDDAPPIPVSNFKLTFTSTLITNPASCGTQTMSAELTGHSGATHTVTNNYTTVNCAPETELGSVTPTPSNDTTPEMTVTANPATGATFECATDSGAWAACTAASTYGPFSDGPHLLRKRACNSIGNCDKTPVEFDITIDTVAPSLSISSPGNGDIVTSADVSVGFDAEDGASTSCRIDGGAYAPCSEPSATFTGLADGPHTVDIQATDAAGNTSTASVSFDVQPECTPGDPGCEFDTEFNDGDNTQPVSPRGDLAITDTTPTFMFNSIPAGAPSFECSIDGGAFFACASPYTVSSPQNVFESHTFAVRATGDTSAAEASYFIDFFAPGLWVDYLDNQDNSQTDTKAAAHPDVDVTFDNFAGMPKNVKFSLPDGFWGSLGSVTQCPLTDVAAGTCTGASKVGSLEAIAVTNDNVAHTFSSDVFMTESPGDDALAGLAANAHVAFDGKDYGYIRDDALFKFNARYVRSNPNYANVQDPRGVDAEADPLPNSTIAHPGPDGPIVMHIRQLKVHLDGDTGLDDGKPLLTAPSSCELKTITSTFTDTEDNPADVPLDYQATDCDDVDFDPTLVQTYASTAAGTDTEVSAVATLPDENATIKRLVLDLPVSIQPQFAGLGDSCLPSDTRLIPPSCNETTEKVGTVEIDTPLLATPLYGKVYLEESGNPLPNLYIYALEPDLGLDVRVRGSVETVGSPLAHLQFKINAEQNGALTDISDLPIHRLEMNLPGGTNGPIARVSTGCQPTDSTSSGDFEGWNGKTKTVTQTISFTGCAP